MPWGPHLPPCQLPLLTLQPDSSLLAQPTCSPQSVPCPFVACMVRTRPLPCPRRPRKLLFLFTSHPFRPVFPHRNLLCGMSEALGMPFPLSLTHFLPPCLHPSLPAWSPPFFRPQSSVTSSEKPSLALAPSAYIRTVRSHTALASLPSWQTSDDMMIRM